MTVWAVIGEWTSAEKWWAVTYRFVEAEAASFCDALRRERQQLTDKLEPIWFELSEHNAARSGRLPRSLTGKTLSQFHKETKAWRDGLKRLKDYHDKLFQEHIAMGLDPLFPVLHYAISETAINSITYRFLKIPEDPRGDRDTAEIIRLRALLYGGADEDDQEIPDED